jgi:hypothetical protein
VRREVRERIKNRLAVARPTEGRVEEAPSAAAAKPRRGRPPKPAPLEYEGQVITPEEIAAALLPPDLRPVVRSKATPEHAQQAEQLGEPGRFKYIRDNTLVWQSQAGMQTDLFFYSNHPAAECDEILLGGLRGPGKGSTLDSPVCTPHGFRPMRDIRVGSLVSNPDGGVAKVVAVFPQGEKDVYRVTFSDGASTKVTDDHLWMARRTCRTLKTDRRYAPFGEEDRVPYKIWTTAQLRELLDRESGKDQPANILIPLTKPVEFTTAAWHRWGSVAGVDPYVVGLLLGDGSLRPRVRFTTADPWLIGELRSRTGVEFTQDSEIEYRAVGASVFIEKLKWLGIHGKLAHEKFVPELYKLGPADVRREVLRGLMDTVGSADTRDGSCTFCSVSRQLAQDAQYLARSLGYRARLREKEAGYRNDDGEYVQCRNAFEISIQGQDLEGLFSLPRKRELAPKRFNGGVTVPHRRITNIEYCGKEEAQCIAVDHPNQLYLTDDFIVTHNTDALLAWMAEPVSNPKYLGLILRFSAEALKETIERATEMYGHLGAKVKDRPPEFHFPSGAKILTGHLRDERSVDDYKGHEYHRIGVEEATQLPRRELYLKLFGSNRSTVPGIKPKILLTSNPDGPGNCVPYGDVLTPDGWKDIRQFKVGDPVYTVDRNGDLLATVVAQVHKDWHDGEMASVDMRGFHMACTPNHRVAKLGGVKRDRDKLFSLVQFKDLPGQAQILRSVKWEGASVPDFTLPDQSEGKRKRKLRQPCGAESGKFFQLMGWFLSEGFTLDRDKMFGISQVKPAGRDALTSLMSALGFSGRWAPGSFCVYSENWWRYFRQFGKAHDKFIPSWMKRADQGHLRLLFEALMAGDGHWEQAGKSGTYYTVSPRLADDVSEIAVKLGFQVYTSRRLRPNSKRIQHQVNFKSNGLPGIEFQTGHHVYKVGTTAKKKPAVRYRAFRGWVYCLGIPGSHAFVLRQRGAVWVSGNSWIKSRFIKVYVNGKLIEPKTPFRDPIEKRTRIFIPGRRDENKILLANDPGYYDRLAGLPEHLRRAWVEGDWDAPASSFYPEFRRYGPLLTEGGLEPDEARHVIPARKLPAWCHRWASMDWGYGHHASANWGCRGPDKRVHVYRELVVRKMGSDILGAEFAKLCVPDLEGLTDHHLVLYLSHEAFSARDREKTIADQIRYGIEMILGPGSAFLLALNEDEQQIKNTDPDAALRSMMRRREDVGDRVAITIRRCNPDRPAGWSYLRTLLRWEKIRNPVKPDYEWARKLLEGPDGNIKYAAYLDLFKDQSNEVLPGILIHDNCPILIETIPKLISDPKRSDDVLKFDGDEEAVGDDPADSLRFLAMAYQDHESKVPFQVWMEQEMEKYLPAGTDDINLKIQVVERARSRYLKQERKETGILLPRESMALR